jgi:hypothetical protein
MCNVTPYRKSKAWSGPARRGLLCLVLGLIYTMVLKESAEVDRKPHSLSDVIHVRGSEHFTRLLCQV